MNLTECYPTHETLASACKFAAGMVKAQGVGTDKPACDLELHLNLAARRLREIGLAPADGVWMPLATGANTDELVGNLMRACGADPADDDDRARLDRMERFLKSIPDSDLQQETLDERILFWVGQTAEVRGWENRLDAVENFLEIAPRTDGEANTLDNRLTDYANANAEALNRNLDVAIKALEERLSARLADVEENILDLTRLVDRLTNSVDRQLNVLCGINEFQQDMESRLKVVEEFNDLIPRLDIQSHRAMEKLAALSAPLAAMESRLAAIESKLTR